MIRSISHYELPQEPPSFQVVETNGVKSMPVSIRPPFTLETAVAKVRAAEDAWNTRDPETVSRAYSENSRWRNRAEFFEGRRAIIEFLRRKWARELDYR